MIGMVHEFHALNRAQRRVHGPGDISTGGDQPTTGRNIQENLYRFYGVVISRIRLEKAGW